MEAGGFGNQFHRSQGLATVMSAAAVHFSFGLKSVPCPYTPRKRGRVNDDLPR